MRGVDRGRTEWRVRAVDKRRWRREGRVREVGRGREMEEGGGE